MDSIIKYSLELLSIKSVQEKAEKDAPFGKGTAEALDYVLKLAGSMGFKCVNLDNYIGYAECGEGKPFAVLGHLDTVPIGDGWTKNPLGEMRCARRQTSHACLPSGDGRPFKGKDA